MPRGVSVMEDEGVYGDHLSGISATDGNWHHIAVTWDSHTGKQVLGNFYGLCGMCAPACTTRHGPLHLVALRAHFP